MVRPFQSCLASVLFLTFSMVAVAGNSISPAEKVSLQAGMQRHIDRSLVDGTYLHLDPDTGNVVGLHPVTAHPMILRMGKFYVLCSDFKDDAGKDVNVDFYVARRGNGYVVFHSAVGQRDRLEKLMKAGKVEMLD